MAQGVDPYREYKTTTHLSNTTVFEGIMKFSKSLRIDGQYIGNVEATGLLVLGPTSQLEGDIVCDEVIVGGEVRGNIFANKRLELLSTAKLYGDIRTKKLKIADGVVFEGKCEMIGEDGTVVKPEVRTKPLEKKSEAPLEKKKISEK